MATNRLLILLIFTLIAPAVVAQPEVRIGSEVLLTPPNSGDLGRAATLNAAPPLWNGTEWISAWEDWRAVSGTYIQRLQDGQPLLNPNGRITTGAASSLVPFGSGYLLGTDNGVDRLDHELKRIETLIEGPRTVVAGSTTALAWTDDLERVELIRHDGVVSLSISEILGDFPVRRKAAIASRGDSFLLAWASGPGPTWDVDDLMFNLVGPDGNILLDEPRRVPGVEPGVAAPAAIGTSDGFMLAWVDSIGKTLVNLRTAFVDPAGASVTEPQLAWASDVWGSGRLQLVALTDQTVLLAWWEHVNSTGFSGRSTRAVFLREGVPFGVSPLIAHEAVLLASNSDQVVAFSLDSTTLQFWTASGGVLSEVSSSLNLRRGAPNRTGLEISMVSDLALWKETAVEPGSLVLGSIDPGTLTLSPIRKLASETNGYDLAEAEDRTLLVWSATVVSDAGSSRRVVFREIVDANGDVIVPAQPIGNGLLPVAQSFDDGWLVVWTGDALTYTSPRLVYLQLDSSGAPVGLPSTIAEPLKVDFSSWTPQEAPVLVETGPGKFTLLFHEGTFQFPCRFLGCPRGSGAMIRSVEFVNGKPDSATLRKFAADNARIRPRATAWNGMIVLVWLEQAQYGSGSTRVMGTFLKKDGEEIADPFFISDEVEDYWRIELSVAATPAGLLVTWPASGHPSARDTRIKGVLVAGEPHEPMVMKLQLGLYTEGAFESTLRVFDARTFELYYSRSTPEHAWGGTFQIARRFITIDPLPRRRPALRR